MLYLSLLLVGILLAGLYAGIETGIYSVGKIRLHLLSEEDPHAKELSKLMDRPQEMVSTALVGTNLSHYLCAAACTSFLVQSEVNNPEVWNTILLTPILFLLTETFPKEIFRRYADYLMYKLRWFLRLSHLFYWPVIQCLLAISRLMSFIFRHGPTTMEITRQRFRFFLLEKSGLTQSQHQLTDNILELSERLVEEVMQPLRKTIMVEKSWNREVILRRARGFQYSRYPVYSRKRQDVRGMVHIYDILLHRETDFSVENYQRQVVKIPASSAIPQAIKLLQDSQCPMGLVVKEGKTVGIVTQKDLMEVVVGSLRVW